MASPQENNCSVCLSSMTKGEELYESKCGHQFHLECIMKNPNDLCPLCRTVMGGLLKAVTMNTQARPMEQLSCESTFFLSKGQWDQRLIRIMNYDHYQNMTSDQRDRSHANDGNNSNSIRISIHALDYASEYRYTPFKIEWHSKLTDKKQGQKLVTELLKFIKDDFADLDGQEPFVTECSLTYEFHGELRDVSGTELIEKHDSGAQSTDVIYDRA
ncbi:unnamed protein product [Didymodactylos carnosus]|uniref:RING-type domain-containing protein n=1 Tax=Didymodactylos carnosus TaxID=1234261 RepID=A0A814S8I9_9BILA|nr:unnamed protein product [Didymodactylos carnosus]CAF1142773.1 unnamed protein product [Didymodactylos carnosus]CAF3710319.1 unnamed protein product [Didymodactylos carnosus]CAF3906403.1 unnamed protein product [Didymodactylos carnosus]